MNEIVVTALIFGVAVLSVTLGIINTVEIHRMGKRQKGEE
jgi:hypothetical protein